MPLQIGKTPIVVPRQHQFNEHVNDHQVEFARNVAKRMGTIIEVEDIETLGDVITNYDRIVAGMLMAMFEQPTLRDTIQVLTEIQPLVAEDAEMAALVQQTIPKMQQLNEQQFKGLELEWYKPDEPNKKTEVAEK